MPSMYLSQIRKWILQSPPVEWSILQLRELLIGALRQGPIPQHVAFVMDGNRRFARNHRIETVEGHNLGFEALARILEVCYKSGVRVVTIYAFSIENFKRSKYEVDALMNMAKVKLSQLAQHGDLLDRYGASVRVLGQRGLLKADVLEAIDRAVQMTSHNTRAVLNVCFPYTSHDEISTAIRNTVVEYSTPLTNPPPPFSEFHITHSIRTRHLSAAAERIRAHSPSSGNTSETEDSTSSSTTLHPESPPEDPTHSLSSSTSSSSISKPMNLYPHLLPLPDKEKNTTHHQPNAENHQSLTYPDPESITADILNDHMFTAGLPRLELLVRTSGVERLSDFMLWQCHQDTEIVFLKCLWPEFDLWTFLPILVEWQWRRRKAVERERGAGGVGVSVGGGGVHGEREGGKKEAALL